MIFKLFLVIVLIILELPFAFKIRRETNFVRQTAIAVIMLLIPIIIYGIYILFRYLYINLFMIG